MRFAWLVGCCLLLGCMRARERRAAEHVRTELNFMVPGVDLEAEERAVRNVLGQRKLVVDETVRGAGFVALSASTLDQRLSAVRIITGRGVVLAEDGDVDDLFGASRIALASVTTGGLGSETLLGVAKTERGADLGCAQFFRVRPDGNLNRVEVHVERFGSRACLATLFRLPVEPSPDTQQEILGPLVASVAWPSLSAGIAPTLQVDMRIETGRLDQPEPEHISLRVEADETAFAARENARLAAALARAHAFPEKQASAVALAALALSANQSVDLQLSAYQSALGNAAASVVYREIVALTRAHIQHGWDDLVPEDGDNVIEPGPDSRAPANGEAPDPRDNVIIEPTTAP